jgi:hypothetical protein
VFVRFSAWLNATPERPKGDKSDKPLLSRIAKLKAEKKDDDYQPEMPPVDAVYLIGHLFDVGPVVGTGMGGVALRSEHLIPWQKETGVTLTVWEARTLRRLSADYLAESHKATAIDAVAPWEESPDMAYIPNPKTESLRDSIRALAVL